MINEVILIWCISSLPEQSMTIKTHSIKNGRGYFHHSQSVCKSVSLGFTISPMSAPTCRLKGQGSHQQPSEKYTSKTQPILPLRKHHFTARYSPGLLGRSDRPLVATHVSSDVVGALKGLQVADDGIGDHDDEGQHPSSGNYPIGVGPGLPYP